MVKKKLSKTSVQTKKAKKGSLSSKKEPLSKDLLKVIVCPECKSEVKYIAGKNALICSKCKESYPIKDRIPIMLPKNLR